MDLTTSAALVTGANRGLGGCLVRELLSRGAKAVYATARNPSAIDPEIVADPRVRTLALDITDPASIDAAVSHAPDLNLLINNAGVMGHGSVLDGDLDLFRREIETNYLGTLRATRAFIPLLRRNPPATIVNVLTLVALAPARGMAGYSASKAAAHSMTQALRAELRDEGIEVIGAYPGGIDTDMLAGVDAVKAAPAEVARRILDGVSAAQPVVWPCDASASARDIYLSDPLKLLVERS